MPDESPIEDPDLADAADLVECLDGLRAYAKDLAHRLELAAERLKALRAQMEAEEAIAAENSQVLPAFGYGVERLN